jgi:NTP pyrophosphatase (non-canonical NTP hydrolase)
MLTFRGFQIANEERCRTWHPGFPTNDSGSVHHWNAADWSNAMAGEAGEACNVVKKIRRLETGSNRHNDGTMQQLVSELGLEIADTITYAFLLATYFGIDVESMMRAKFNFVSEREQLPHRI